MTTLFRDIKQKAEEIDFFGVVSAAKNDTAIFTNAFGYRDISNKLPNDTNTKFGIASGTKFFTALGIGTLIEQNKIKLDTEIGEIFNEPTPFIDRKATIKHLLTHTSGVYDYYDEELTTDFDNFFVELPWYKLETPTDYLPLFIDKKMKFTPGERASYSNGGYVLLGIIIERIAKKLYRDYIKENVLDAAGMTDSHFYAFNDLSQNTALGYKKDNTTNIYNLPIRGGGDGGLYTTASDLNKFWKHLFSYDIISRKLLQDFVSPHVRIWQDVEYGYGIYISKINNEHVYFITGSDAGIGFCSQYVPAGKLIINILSNRTNGAAEIVNIIDNHVQSGKGTII
jgi:CubicO group peptidase (beta-lactamase class C family)